MDKLIAAFVFAVALALAIPATAAETTVADTVFSEVEKKIIRDYYATKAGTTAEDDDDEGSSKAKGKGRNKAKGKGKGKGKSKKMPPGLAKRDKLPPGLAKRETLPPGLAKRDLPTDLQHMLPERAVDQEIKLVEDNVVLVEKATGLVLDILEQGVLGGN